MKAISKTRIADAAIEYAEARRYYGWYMGREELPEEQEEERAYTSMTGAKETMFGLVHEWRVLQSLKER